METPNHSVNKQRYIGDLIHENFYDELVIIGYPYDQFSRFHGLRQGAFLAPDSFRRFLKSDKTGESSGFQGVIKNVEYGIDISKYLPQISDYGNIQTEKITGGQKSMQQAQLTELQDKLQSKLTLCLQRKNRAFIMGGSKDIIMPIQKAFAEFDQAPKLFIMITHKLTGKT